MSINAVNSASEYVKLDEDHYHRADTMAIYQSNDQRED